MAYTKTAWLDGSGPAITAANLNKIEQGIADAHTHMADKNNPHGVTKAQVGLGNVANVAQASATDFTNHKNDKNNPHAVTTEQINNLATDYKNGTDSGNTYPNGITQFVVSSATGWPSTSGMVVTNRLSNYRCKQYFHYNGTTRHAFRDWYTDAWSEWVEVETTAGAQAKVNTHANRTDNPHAVTKAQVGLGNVANSLQATKTEFDTHANNKSNPHEVTTTQVTYIGSKPESDAPGAYPTGMSMATANGADWPSFGQWGHVLTFSGGSSIVHQMFFQRNVTLYKDVYFRYGNSTGWSAWEKFQTSADTDARFLLKTDYEDADVLAKIKNVDGSGSGLDADFLDGLHASKFAQLSEYQDGFWWLRRNSPNSVAYFTNQSTGKIVSFFQGPDNGTEKSHIANDGSFNGPGATLDGGSEMFQLKAGSSSNHAYMGFYKNSSAQSTRSGYFGYGSSTSDTLTLQNAIGDINLTASGAVLVSGNYVYHTGNITRGTANPSGGGNGDIYIQI